MDQRLQLVDVIRGVRNRWRMRLAARGAVVVVAGTLLALLLSAGGLESFRFAPGAIIAFRILAIAVFLGLVGWAFVRPMRRHVSDSQVAMYLEECDPTLEAAIISAVEASTQANAAHSPRLVEKLVEQAIEQCRAIERGTAIDRQAMKRHVIALGGVAALTALILALGPSYLRQGFSALLSWRTAEASSPYSIQVKPGSTKVPRGADQAITAQLVGFSASDAAVMLRTDPKAAFERLPLVPAADPATFEGVLFHLEKSTEYLVESNGVRSPIFSLSVVNLPTVSQLDLEYRFPSYTGLAPRKQEGGGDVAAIRGTEVLLHIVPTMAAPSGRILLNDGASQPLTTQADGTLTGSFKITAQGFYKIELTGPHNEKVDASPQYTIDVIDDQPPAVHFSRPGRDTQASPVEELFLEARADDDYGVKQLQLFYSANGATPKMIPLFSGPRPLTEVSAGHTIYLEELGLKPGDFVSYYAKATDTDGVQGAKTATSDIYFVQIRPFKKDYKPAQSQAMGGGGGGAGQQVGELSRQQREIVSATFNVVRDKPKLKPEKFRENVVFLNLAQAKLREQVEELVGKLKARLGVVDAGFSKIAEVLPQAVVEMKSAEGELKGLKADAALSPEQRALKLLQQAEEQYELQVSMQNGGGGGGGGQGQMAEDLADLFELELDKLANQYEMQQRAEQQQSDHTVDEMVEKLKELARRQQQEMERQRRLAQAGQQGGAGGSSASQRALAEEAEKAARQLQQLTRDQQRQDLNDAMRRVQEAADAMRRAAANGSSDGGAQANEALSRLREAQQRLERNQGGRGERDMQAAQRQAAELAQEQKQVASDVNALEQTGAGREEKAQGLAQRKDAMDAKVADLQSQLERLANQVRRDEKDAARKLDEAAGSIRDKRIREEIRYSKSQLRGSPGQYARAMEDDIAAKLDALEKKVNEAAGAMGKSAKQDAVGRAADKARDLVRGMESMDQRMRDRAQNGRNQQGQNGQNGQNGQRSQQNGQQGQQGGQQGQQGQQGSQGSQGAEGQQGGQQGGQANSGGGPNGPGYGDARNWGGYYGGRWDPNDIRQWRGEYRQWANDADALRRQLQAAGVNPRELDDIIRDLRMFDNDRLFADPQGLEKLQAAAIDRLKKFEFGLRRKTDAGNDSLSLSGSDQVPDGFRQAIEEYYRSLAKKQQQQ